MAAKLRIGFVGAGFMGQLAHIRSYALLREECELVALAEPRQRTAELVAARYGIDRVYRDHRELLESEQLDGIVAAQKFTYHAALLPELYPHVPHLFTEKPLALSAATGDRLARLASESGCVHMLGYQRRSDPATVEAKRTVDDWKASGDVGGLRYLRICYSDGDWTGNARARLIDAGEQPPPLPAEERPPAQPVPALPRGALPARFCPCLGAAVCIRERVRRPDDDRGDAVPTHGRVRRGTPRRVRARVRAALACAVARAQPRGPARDLPGRRR